MDAALVGEEKDRFKGFGGFLAIVNDYIKAGSHSEVNLESRTKGDIQKYSKFKAYALLDLVREERQGRCFVFFRVVCKQTSIVRRLGVSCTQ